jgi:hypothetical protein
MGVSSRSLADSAVMLNGTQLLEVREVGWTRLPAVVPTEAVATMNERIWAFYGKRGVARNEPDTWPVGFSGRNRRFGNERGLRV